MAETMTGNRGRMVEALPLAATRDIIAEFKKVEDSLLQIGEIQDSLV